MLVTALIFFDHLRLYNQTLFLYASTTMGGFESDTVPDYVNLRDTVFFPVMETLGITLIGLVPLVTMRVFAEERARGTDELLLTTALGPAQIVAAKFAATFLFVIADDGGELRLPGDGDRAGRRSARSTWPRSSSASTLHAIALASIGLACSAWTSSQLVAAVAGWAVGFVLWDFAVGEVLPLRRRARQRGARRRSRSTSATAASPRASSGSTTSRTSSPSPRWPPRWRASPSSGGGWPA